MTTACPACGTDNRQGRKFCARCGAALGATCPACGTANQPDERFCGECGVALEPSSPSASSPAAVPVAGERKHITVLFADVAGSMDLQENLDPEVWAQIMGRFVSILAEGVRKFGGTVDKFTGDGIMALFGAPVAQEDHARRACHAAWHLTKEIAGYADELRDSQGVDLHVRLGVNSGEVVVGRVGDDVTLDPTALGHTVGLAQRMEAMAEPGTAYLTEHSARLVEDWFRLNDLGTMVVKGSREPLRVYVLGAPLYSPVRRRVGASPLVGRERELAVLEDALGMAMEGHAQVVGVVGEAGVGKSRLCEEFVRSAAARGITVRRTAGVSHATDVPLLPILSLMRDYFGIAEADTSEQAREKIAAYLLALDPGLAEALPLLYDFLEVPDPEHPVPQLAPDVRMRRVFDTLRHVTQRRSTREVLVLVVEDLHWFDPQSETFLGGLVESFPGSRTLVLANFRPEFSSTWMRHSYYRQLPLAPLRDDAVGELLGGLLGVDLLVTPLLRFVVGHTAGNPFFVEEVVRSLVEDGTLAGGPGSYRLTLQLHEVKVPPSVQAVLAARIDRLLPEDKTILQTAAVIGRTFNEAVLAKVTGLAHEVLEDHLSALCGAELLQQVGRNQVTEYRFWHPLTQEVAYSTLLAARRTGLHATVARALFDLDPDRADERAALIATHFERAGEALEAAQWHFRAATWALRNDVNEALRRWRAVLDHLSDLSESEQALSLGIRARARLLQWGARTGIDAGEAEDLAAAGRALAQRLGDAGQLAAIIQFHGTVLVSRGRLTEALASYLEAADLGERTGDAGLAAATSVAAPVVYAYVGPLTEGLRIADRVVALCDGVPDLGAGHTGYSPLARTLLARADLLALAGRFGEAHDDLNKALAIARSRADMEIVVWALSTYPRLAWYSGEQRDSLVRAKESVQVAEDSGNLMVHLGALQALGIAELLAGRPQDAAAVLKRAHEETRKSAVGGLEGASVLAYLALAHLGCSSAKAARSAAGEALSLARRQEARVLECLALLIRAQVFQATGNAGDGVADDLSAALALSNDTGALTYEPFIREELGRLRGDERQLREALRLYRQIGATGHARRLETELAGSLR